jgi:hypothetical protein
MKAKEANAQLEVWEWKQKAYEEVKHLSMHDAIAYILKKTQPLTDELKRQAEKQKIKKECLVSWWCRRRTFTHSPGTHSNCPTCPCCP